MSILPEYRFFIVYYLIFISASFISSRGRIDQHGPMSNLKLMASNILNSDRATFTSAPPSLDDYYGAALILNGSIGPSSLSPPMKCNCKTLASVLRNFKNSLDIYFGLKTMELCSCPEKYNDRMQKRVNRDMEVCQALSRIEFKDMSYAIMDGYVVLSVVVFVACFLWSLFGTVSQVWREEYQEI